MVLMNGQHHPLSSPPTRIVVTGGTGKVGRRVVRRLRDTGHDVLAVSRSTDPSLDWDDPSTFPPVLAGAEAVFVGYAPDIAFPAAAAALAGLADAAVAAGARRFVVLSGRGEPEAEPAERAVCDVAAAVGGECTVLRCAWFAQNFSEHFLLDGVLDGVVALPAGSVREPFVDLDDVADVAVDALLGAPWSGRTLDLTGPELLSFADVATVLTRAIGRPVAYVPCTVHEYVEGAVAAGAPRDEIEPLADLFARVLDGHNSTVSPDLGAVLGRAPGRFADYVARTVRSGVWDVAATAHAGGAS
jgi:uncharacterized protein YbjT (DUF2867 family)